MKILSLTDAIGKYPLKGLYNRNVDMDKQHLAYTRCLEFFRHLEPASSFNKKRGSYGLKHDAERYNDCFYPQHIYVYEGTAILAALASGFKLQQPGNSLHGWLNFSQKSLTVLQSIIDLRKRQFSIPYRSDDLRANFNREAK